MQYPCPYVILVDVKMNPLFDLIQFSYKIFTKYIFTKGKILNHFKVFRLYSNVLIKILPHQFSVNFGND